MDDDARLVYKEQLRLIEEEEACEVEAAHLSAALKRNAAHRRYLHAREKALLAAYKKPRKADGAVQSKPEGQPASLVQNIFLQQTNSNSTHSPTYIQHGDGGQYVAEHMYTAPAANQ